MIQQVITASNPKYERRVDISFNFSKVLSIDSRLLSGTDVNDLSINSNELKEFKEKLKRAARRRVLQNVSSR